MAVPLSSDERARTRSLDQTLRPKTDFYAVRTGKDSSITNLANFRTSAVDS
jgi:hypothetical protein